MPYYYKTQINKINELNTINIKENNIESYQSFAFVSLFFKLVKEEYFFSSNFDQFSNYFKKNNIQYNDYLLNVCDLQKKILVSLSQGIESHSLKNKNIYLQEYKDLIQQTFNTPVENAYIYSHKDFSFMRYLNSDATEINRNYDIKKETNSCHFYFIQELGRQRRTYGIFAFKKYGNNFFVLYDPYSGIKEYSLQEIAVFENDFKSIIKRNSNSYCSFKIKFIANKKVFFNSKENFLKHLIYVSATKYLNSIKDNKIKYNLGIGVNNKEYNFVINYIKIYTNNSAVNDKKILTMFFINFYYFLETLVKENYNIQKSSFWLFFMLEYFYLDENYINPENSKNYPKLYNTKADSIIKEKSHNLFYFSYLSKSQENINTIKKLFNFLMEHLYIEQFNYNPKNNFFTNIFLNKYTPIVSKNDANKIGTAWLKTFASNANSSCNDWNRQYVIYNNKLISKRYDRKAEQYNPAQRSPRHSPTITTSDTEPTAAFLRASRAPTETELKEHLNIVTENSRSNLANFCFNYCNQNNIFSIGHVLTNFFIQFGKFLSFNNCAVFINKVASHCFEINISTNISQHQDASTLNNPFEFVHGFLLTIDNDQFKFSDFHFGMLNLEYTQNQEQNNITNYFKKILNNQVTIDFSEKNRHNQYINTKKTFLNFLQLQIK